jgi:hypothetical protein
MRIRSTVFFKRDVMEKEGESIEKIGFCNFYQETCSVMIKYELSTGPFLFF